MAVKITVTKVMETKIRNALQSGPAMEHCGPIIRQLVSAIDDAHDKQKRKADDGGLNPHDVIKAIKNILGGKAVSPPNPGAAFFGFVKKRAQFLNVSLEDIERAAVHVRTGNSKAVRLPTTVDWFMRKLDVLLAEADEATETQPTEDEWTIVTGR